LPTTSKSGHAQQQAARTDPQKHVETLLNLPGFVLVEKDHAPKRAKIFVAWANTEGFYAELTEIVASIAGAGFKTFVFCKSTNTV
jgi:ATP-dependent helicase YprA (DUF1998 family)